MNYILYHFKFPGYTDGLVVVGLLIFIGLMIFKAEKKMQLPPFCTSCANWHERPFSSTYCTLKCQFNPQYAHNFTGNYYVKKRGR